MASVLVPVKVRSSIITLGRVSYVKGLCACAELRSEVV